MTLLLKLSPLLPLTLPPKMRSCKKLQIWHICVCYFSQVVLIFGQCMPALCYHYCAAFIVLNFRSKICFCNILTGLPYFATKVMVILGVPYLYTVVADNKHDMIYQHCGVRTVLSLYQHCSQSTLLIVECYQTNIMFLFIIHRL